MKKTRTISLEAVLKFLRHGHHGKVESLGGWSVFVDSHGERFYVVDESDCCAPVPYQSMRFWSAHRRSPLAPSLSITS